MAIDSQRMKVVIPGGSGQIGAILARHFQEEGHEVVVLSRRRRITPWKVVEWDARTIGDWAREIENSDVVINLAGQSVNCRYKPSNRREILASRVDSTQVVGQAIRRTTHPPKVWLQAGTATIYSHRFDAPNEETSGLIGGSEPDAPEKWRFSIEVAKSWEQALNESPTPRTRKVVLRSAMTMSPDRGGVFDTFLGLVRRGLGGRHGDGRQYVSWIHERDFVRAIRWVIAREDMDGPINITSPSPLPNDQFMSRLREAWGISFGLPATPLMLGMGSLLIGTETELILKSRYVIPRRLEESGFDFQYPTWSEAAKDLCRRWREIRSLNL